jgi:hypothetical protein
VGRAAAAKPNRSGTAGWRQTTRGLVNSAAPRRSNRHESSIMITMFLLTTVRTSVCVTETSSALRLRRCRTTPSQPAPTFTQHASTAQLQDACTNHSTPQPRSHRITETHGEASHHSLQSLPYTHQAVMPHQQRSLQHCCTPCRLPQRQPGTHAPHNALGCYTTTA